MAASCPLGTGLRDSRPNRRHGDKHHGNLPLLWSLEGRKELREHTPHTEASKQDPGEVTPFGPMCLLPSHEGPLPARSCLSRGNATSTSVLDECLAPASQETVGSNWVQTPPIPAPGAREEGRRSPRGGGLGLPSKVGAGTDATMPSLYQAHTQLQGKLGILPASQTSA